MLSVAVEGISDEAVVRRLCTTTGVEVGAVYVTGGKPKLDARLGGFNHSAQYRPWLVLRDLDTDAGCAPTLRAQLLPHPAPGMHLRIPVTSIEAWLLADRTHIAQFLGISLRAVPTEPDSLMRPKRTLVDLAQRSRKRAIREDLVPREGTARELGPGYTARIIEFATTLWNPEEAAERSDSLARCIRRLKQLSGDEA